jgi:TRAP-type uncharacterized transport system fused permease subunit
MGPLLVGLGIAHFTAHMFIFYFACASAITPPVAVASYAASTITRADPIATSLSAVRSGAVMFVIPFVFAFYPELLLIPAAMLSPDSVGGNNTFLPGYDGTVHIDAFLWLLARLTLALYLLASALARFDYRPLGWLGISVRLILAVALLASDTWVNAAAVMAALAVIYAAPKS